MTKLIIALAAAHSALISEAGATDDKSLGSTARKVEATLIDCLGKIEIEARTNFVADIMNSGSLKALKLIPEEVRIKQAYGRTQANPDFILTQPASFLREAQKRGFEFSPDRRAKMIIELAEASNHARIQAEVMVLNGPVTSWLMSKVLSGMFELDTEKAEKAAPLAVKILKKGAKENPKDLQNTIDNMFSIYDPAAAHEDLYKTIVAYALLGAKRPAKTVFEHDEMARLAREVLSPAGRKTLQAEMGDLETFLSNGHRNLKGIFADFQRKRVHFKCPGSRRRY